MKPPGRRLHRWITAAILSIAFGLPLFLPWIIQQTAVAWLQDQGIETAAIDDIDINLFTGKLDIKGFDAGDGLKWQRLSMRINWLPLLNRTLHIRSLQLSGADILLQQDVEKGGLMLGALLLPQGDGDTQKSSNMPSSPWNIVLQRITIEDVAMAAEGVFRARLALLNVLGNPAADGTGQMLQSEINLDGIELQAAGQRLSIDDLYLAGQLTLPPLDKIESADVSDSRLRLEGALLKTPQGDALSLQALRLNGVEVAANRQVRIGQLIMRSLKVRRGDLRLAGLGKAAVSNIEADEQLLTRLESIALTDIELPADDRHALGRIATLNTGPVTIASASEVNVDSIEVAGLDLSLLRDKQGMAVISALASAAATPAQESAAAGAARTEEKKLLALKVEAIRLADGCRLAVRDETISPVLRLEMKSKGVSIDKLDSSGAGQGRFKAGFALNGDGALQADGSFRLKPDAPELEMHMALLRFDISSLSGYLEQGFGHAVQTGQLDVKSNIAVAGGELKAENSLTIRRLSVKKSDIPGNAVQKLGMPLNTALDMLRDDRGDIALKVPLSGRLDDLNVDISDAINQALASALGSAALSYASLLLQPYGSILPALSYTSDLIEAAGKPRLTPVTFAPGSQQLSSDATGYAAKLAGLLDKKPLRLELCGIAHRSEAATSLNDEALLQLATERARVLRAAITAHGIAPERLFNCRPAIDEKSKLPGRVELLLD